MSFSHEVKEELVKHMGNARHCQLAELAAILHFCGQYGRDAEGHFTIGFQVENATVVKKCFTLLKKTYSIDTDAAIDEEKMQELQQEFSELIKQDREAQENLLNIFKDLGYEIKL